MSATVAKIMAKHLTLEKLLTENLALRHDLNVLAYNRSGEECFICKHGKNYKDCKRYIEMDDCFEWRGVCAKNSGKDKESNVKD